MTSNPSTATRPRPAFRARASRLAAGLAALAVVAGGIVGTAAPASASVVWTGSVPAGTVLNPGDSVTSPNGQFRLILQGDGNLVEYGIGNAVLWASGTSNKPGATVKIGKDRSVDLVHNGKRVTRWALAGKKSSTSFVVRGDGTMALLAGTESVVNWKGYQDRVTRGNVILGGTTLRSDASGTRTLEMKTDGNLVQRISGKAVWQSRTGGNPGSWAAVQNDGNLVVYKPGKKAIWHTGTYRSGGGSLLVQVDGNVVLYGKKDTRIWSTKPVTGLLWPVLSTKISGRYGDDRGANHVPRYHQGTDAPVAVGTPVYASGTGTVTSAVANNASYGNYVVVTYGNVTVLTAHLSKIQVKKGQIISRGIELGKSGNTGQSTGPHVHVETRRGGTLVDPLSVLHFR
ncbi:peptidoglycan DD-metalloendopeptidase family protein [Curtobacterium sp. NPDC089689]|uniref:peptidoglycan DD-metalloendopeptidase family protein n=1 Tax=Curtobacterium sp. NPDC089689 TaxID=3363968 RepID=UPI00382FFE89